MASEYKDRLSKVLDFKCFAFEKFWPYFEKQNGCHRQLFKNHYDALKLEILQLGSSNMGKIYMARKVSLIVIWPNFENKMTVISHVK